MKSRKNRNISRKNRKGGGFFFGSSNVAPYAECDINNLSNLSRDMGDGQNPLIKMRNNYQKCCPKDFMWRKNSSPYCKQLDMNFTAQTNYQRDIAGYYGDETDVSKIREIMNEPVYTIQPGINTNSYNKPWYRFWGGKKTIKHRTNRKYSHRRR